MNNNPLNEIEKKESNFFSPQKSARKVLRNSKTVGNIFPKKKTKDFLGLGEMNQGEIKFSQRTKKSENLPPIYFYKKISSPYKYNINSIPNYLIRSNGEKFYTDKVNNIIENETDKKALDDILNKDKNNKNKDRYKPKLMDVNTFLKYRPGLFNKGPKTTIKNKSISSINLFEEHVNEGEKNESNNVKVSKERLKYQISDIYNLRNDQEILDKYSRNYFLKNKNKTDQPVVDNQNFFINSKNDWLCQKALGSKMNTFSSVCYDILAPNYKCSYRFKNASELNKDNLYNESPYYRKVKSIGEFTDLTTKFLQDNTINNLTRNKKGKTRVFKTQI